MCNTHNYANPTVNNVKIKNQTSNTQTLTKPHEITKYVTNKNTKQQASTAQPAKHSAKSKLS